MKWRVTLLAMLGMGIISTAQDLEWGVKGGLTYNLTELGLSSAVSASGEVFNGERSHNGWHVGLAVRDDITDNFYVQLDGLYNRTSHTVHGVGEGGGSVQESIDFTSAQFNLTPGIRMFNFLRLQGGLNGNLAINDAYEHSFGSFGLGYQLGVGVDLGPLTLDIGYNASFSEHNGQWNGIPLNSNRGELLMSVGIFF